MIRCTIEIIPGGVEDHTRREVIGVIEIANCGGTAETGHYRFVLAKKLGLKRIANAVWRQALAGRLDTEAVNEVLVGDLAGFPRKRLGPYDLMYRALKACGMEERNRG